MTTWRLCTRLRTTTARLTTAPAYRLSHARLQHYQASQHGIDLDVEYEEVASRLRADFRSTLRSLLRQARLLPDPASRAHVRQQALNRYRQHHDDASTAGRQTTRLHSASRDLKTLRRANEGYLDPNVKIIMLTYGRTGRRKHDLLLSLADSNSTSKSNTAASEDTKVILKGLPDLHPANAFKIPEPSAKHLALLKSQMHFVNPFLNQKSMIIRKLTPDVPPLNSWKRIMPQKRQLNYARAYWKMLMQRTLPPLDAADWERLRRLATGEEVPSRLSVINKPYHEGRMEIEQMHGDLEGVLKGRGSLRKVTAEEKVSKAGGRAKPHEMTARFMRRIWAQVFQLCPKMEFDKETKLWRTRWGVTALKEARRGRNQSDDFDDIVQKV